MTVSHRIGFVGAGAMSGSILAGLIQSRRFSPTHISVVGKTQVRVEQLKERFDVGRDDCVEDLAENNDVLCLCIKPRDLPAIAEKMSRISLSGKLLISTLAGVDMQALRYHFPEPCLVRAIPNISSEIIEGVTLWAASEETPKDFMEFARQFWQAVGISIEVSHEDHIDLATPISGADPAFIGLFMEALIDAAVFLGLPRDMAGQLVLQSLKGSCELIGQQNLDAHLVRQRVTSPGGLTAVCIAKLEESGFRTVLLEAIRVGHSMTMELGLRRKTV